MVVAQGTIVVKTVPPTFGTNPKYIIDRIVAGVELPCATTITHLTLVVATRTQLLSMSI